MKFISFSAMYFLGIDVGTQGARALICDNQGQIAAQTSRAFAPACTLELPAGWAEQSPADWWSAVLGALKEAVAIFQSRGLSLGAVRGASVTSTSGTVCLADAMGNSLGPAIMYNDNRSVAEVDEVKSFGGVLAGKLGYSFSCSFALPKLLWLKRRRPADFHKATHLQSPTDFIIGRLTGNFGLTDYTNALKTGYDLLDGHWPGFIESKLDIPIGKLPRVAPPGAPAGTITGEALRRTGLPAGIPVFTGMTDGCASQVSTGAVSPGQWNSTLGTTLVVKGVNRKLIRDPAGRVYCHRHPDSYWLPGGASNTGGDNLTRTFEKTDLRALDDAALGIAPSGLITYPLMGKGERFPFVNPDAEGFFPPGNMENSLRYTACLEGVGYLERLCYDVLAGLGAEIGPELSMAGGGAQSAAWLQIRADILGKTLLVPESGGGAKGAAIIAAGASAFGGLTPAATAMVRISRRVQPRPRTRTAYDEGYGRFLEMLRQRRYIP